MKETIEERYNDLKEQNNRLLMEIVDLKLENEQLKTRVQSLECVRKMLEGSGLK